MLLDPMTLELEGMTIMESYFWSDDLLKRTSDWNCTTVGSQQIASSRYSVNFARALTVDKGRFSLTFPYFECLNCSLNFD